MKFEFKAEMDIFANSEIRLLVCYMKSDVFSDDDLPIDRLTLAAKKQARSICPYADMVICRKLQVKMLNLMVRVC